MRNVKGFCRGASYFGVWIAIVAGLGFLAQYNGILFFIALFLLIGGGLGILAFGEGDE